jgi:hypothetical protein
MLKMFNFQQEDHTASTHQTVTEEIKLKTGGRTIKIGVTDQKLSAHAGQATFWAFLHRAGFRPVLAKALPHRPTSPNALAPVELAVGFLSGILAGADKLTRIAHLRHDPVLPEILNVKRLPSQSTLSRFLAGFDGQAKTLEAFRPLWRWAMEQLPSRKAGYSLDFDSTELLHEDGHQEGVKVGYTRSGLKPCLHPLLAVLEEVKLVACFWLRPGNASSANNIIAFTLETLSLLPSHLRVRLVRADSGFCQDDWLSLLEARGLPYIVVAKLHVKLQGLITRDTVWQPSGLEGTEVAEVVHESPSWSQPRRIVLLRHHKTEGRRVGGRTLFDCPGYRYQALVTSLPQTVAPLDVWRDYNARAGIESVIKELDYGFALPKLCCQKFWATEAALSLAVVTYNLTVLFLRHLGWLERNSVTTLRYRLFGAAGILSHAQGTATIRLGVPPAHRPWWRALWDKILSPFPNCDAVAQQPRPAQNYPRF